MELAAAIVAVAEVTARCSSKVWKLCHQWKDVPRDIVQLRDDLERSGRFLEVLRQVAPDGALLAPNSGDESGNWLSAGRDLGVLLRQGHVVVDKLHEIVDELVDPSPKFEGGDGPQQEAESWPSSIRTSRKILWLRRAQDVKKLKASLNHITTQIGFQLALLNLAVSTDVRCDIEESEQRLTTQFRQGFQSATEDVTTIVRESSWEVQEHISKATWSAATRVIQNLALLDLTRQSEQTRQLARLHDAIQSQGHHLDEVRMILLDLAPPIHTPGRHSLKQHRRPGKRETPASQPPCDLGWSSLAGACSKACNCHCHSVQSSGRWEFGAFQQVFGAVRVTFSGSFVRSRASLQCTNRTCQGSRTRSSGRLNVTYTLPSWISAAVVSLGLARLPDPEFLIRVHRIVPLNDQFTSSSNIFAKVILRDIEATRQILRERPSAVHDIRGHGGSTVLRYALPGASSTGSLEIARLLVQAGADPFQEDSRGITAISTAFSQFLLMEDPEIRDQMADLMPFDRYIDDKDFTDLHRLVAGFQPLDLAAALQNPHYRDDVRNKSADGTTPLHLASSRGDARAVELLLAAGADVNAASTSGITPLGAACHRCHEKIIAMLLAHGASPLVQDASNGTPLHYVAISSRYSTGALDLLLRYGADVDVVDRNKSTPLALAARRDGVDAIRDLLARGADVDHQDWEGDVPLNEGLTTKSHKAVAVLLGAGADCTVVNDHGWTVLHWLAAMGDVTMVAIVEGEARRLAGVDVDGTDHSGKTAMDVVDQRGMADVEFRLAFQRLLGRVREEGAMRGPGRIIPPPCCEGGDESDAEEFFDAREGNGP
jgi:ankyrin repeat protein